MTIDGVVPRLSVQNGGLAYNKSDNVLVTFGIHRARCSSMLEHPLMVQWVIVGSIPFVGPTELFLNSASTPRQHCKCHGKCYPVCGMVNITMVQEPLLLIGKNNP